MNKPTISDNDSSSEELLDQLFAQSPLGEPPAWFATHTLARIRRTSSSQETRWLRWIWTGAGSLCLLLIWVSVEIREQSTNELISLASLDDNSLDEGSEDAWLE